MGCKRQGMGRTTQVCEGLASRPRCLLLRRLSGNVGKHSLEYFASDFVRVFLGRVLGLGFFAFSGTFRVGRLHFLCNHRKHLNCIVARASGQPNPLYCLEPFRTTAAIPRRGQRYALRTLAALRTAAGGRNTIVP
jgi:hypothetical protein